MPKHTLKEFSPYKDPGLRSGRRRSQRAERRPRSAVANLVVFELEGVTERSALERVFRGLVKRALERPAARTSPAAFSTLFGDKKGMKESGKAPRAGPARMKMHAAGELAQKQ